MPKPLRIFISSPGDVASERRRAALVVESLKKEFARFFEITAYLWEHEAMLATGHFQDVIEPPSQSDIVVLILWSRLGTPLPEKSGSREYRGIDGRAPVTGTEWEYEDALAANRSKGAPDLLVYRSNKEPQISLRDPSKKAMAENQWTALENFWSRYFQAGGVFLSAFHGFDDLEDFGDMLEAHLRQLIRSRIEKGRIEGGTENKATWLQSPFRGLSSYDFEHAPIFFGRGAAQLKAVEQVVKNANEGKAFLLVLGASGSGKSSLVRAGLLPNLFARGVADGAGLWRRIALKPADAEGNLFRGLARALVDDRVKEGIGLPEILGPGVTIEQLENALRRSIDDPAFVFQPALGRVTAEARASGRIMAHENAKLAIVLDQFEEIFTDTAITTEERNTFIHLIGALSRTGSVWVIATMRSDFWHRAAAAPELVSLAEGMGRMDLLPPSQAELAEMIRRPAAAAGLTFEDHSETRIGLDAVIAEEAARDPGSLPLVSFMLDALYKSDIEGKKGSTLTYETYESLGGIKGAIAKRADEILSAQTPEVQGAFPAVLRALVTVDSDRDHNATARVTPLATFPPGSSRRALVDAFLDPQARLLIADGDGGEARVRVAHEALINHWTRAREQINRDRRDLETRARLEEDELLWRAAPPAEKSARLLEGLALEEGKDLVEKWGDELPQSLKDYIEESYKAATRRRRRSFRILTAVAAVMAVLAVASGVAGLYAINYAGIADENAAMAQQAADEANRARTATADQLRETKRGTARLIERQSYTASKQGYPELALALAVESVRVGQETGELPRASLAALQHAASTDTIASVLSLTQAALSDITFGADSSTILTERSDGYLTLWNATDGSDISSYGSADYTVLKSATDWTSTYMVIAFSDKEVQVYKYSDLSTIGNVIKMDGAPTALDIDKQGRMIAIGDDQGNVRFVDPADQTILAMDKAHESAVADVEIAENLSIAVSVGENGQAVIWDLQTMAKRGTAAHGDPASPYKVSEVVIAPHGDQFVLVGDGIASIYAADGTKLGELNFADRFLYKAAYTPDGQYLLYAAGKDVTVVPVSDVMSTGRTLAGHTFDVRGLDISEDGKRILTYSGDNTLRLWDFASGATLRLFRSPKGSINAQGLSRDGNHVAAVFDDGNAVVWTVEGLAPLSARKVHSWNINSLQWSADGSQILTSAGDGTAMISESESSFPVFDLKLSPATSAYNAIYTPDGKQIVTADNARNVRLWNAATGDEVKTVATLEDNYYPYWIAVSPDGKSILVATYGSVRVIDLATGAETRRLNAPGIALFTMEISPDGKRVAAGADDGRLFIWDFGTGKPIAELREHRSAINAVNFSPDSKRIVTASSDRTIRIWDADTGAVQLLLSGHDDIVLWAAFSPDGQRVISSSFDASVRLWDAQTGAELGNFVGPSRPFRAALYSPDGKRIAAVGDDQRLYLWDVSVANGANTPTAAPILAAELNVSEGKLLKEMIAWAPLTVSKPLSPSDRRANYLEPDPGVRQFDTNPDACDVLASYQSDPQRRAPGAPEGQLNLADALTYCKAAVEASPNEPRFHLQYGRALIGNDQRPEGLKEVQIAVDAGYPGAIYYLALYLIEPDIGTAEDLKKGMDLAYKSRDLGVPDAGDLVAKQTLDGLKSKDGQIIVKQDRQAALKLYEEAANNGSWFASINLAFLYEYDQKDEDQKIWLAQNKVEALYYFALAARQVEIEGFVESTEARRASFLFAHRASLARWLVRNGKSAEVAAVAERLAQWKPPANQSAAPATAPAAAP